MVATASFVEHVKDLFVPFGEISIRKMFGGAGVYCDGRIFAIVGDDDLWFKADAETIPAFEAAGLGRFAVEWKDGVVGTMSYYAVPDEIFDDVDELRRWTGLALAAAARRRGRSDLSVLCRQERRYRPYEREEAPLIDRLRGCPNPDQPRGAVNLLLGDPAIGGKESLARIQEPVDRPCRFVGGDFIADFFRLHRFNHVGAEEVLRCLRRFRPFVGVRRRQH